MLEPYLKSWLKKALDQPIFKPSNKLGESLYPIKKYLEEQMTYALEVRNVSQSFGDKKVLNGVDFTIKPGEFVSLVGPSGCGKSTLFRAILGTHPTQVGEIWAEGKKVVRPSRDVGIVYQHYSLYDYLTAEGNVAFGLAQDQTNLPYRLAGYFGLNKWRKLRRTHLEQARDLLAQVGLQKAINQYPAEMSGGMKQRVAIAQALIMKPKILLLDEPFGALDEATREELQDMIVDLYQVNEKAKAEGKVPPYTILIVTHELNEAIYLSDRILGLSQYHSDGVGAKIVYDKPATAKDHNSERDYGLFLEQKQEIRNIIFNEKK